MEKVKFSRGGVSMFIVIITMTLITIITASFLRLMVRDQQMASVQDLTQSAYDSAQAGVEDTKRFVEDYMRNCGGVTRAANCDNYEAVFNDNSCYAIGRLGVGNNSGETIIRSSSGGGADLNQAYTCLKVNNIAPNFLVKIEEGSSKLIPLKGDGVFNKVKISWHNNEDGDVDNPTSSSALTNKGGYGNIPATVAATFLGYRKGQTNIDEKEINSSFSGDGVGLSRRIYHPSLVGVSADILPTNRSVQNSSDINSNFETNIAEAECSDVADRAYKCAIEVNLGGNIDSGSIDAFLSISTIYRGANIKVELFNDSNLVNFKDAQFVVDSTGRANDQFRRVESRVEVVGGLDDLPNAALYVGGGEDFCKQYRITYKNITGCL